MLSRRKLEPKIIEVIKQVLLDPAQLEVAAKILNDMIKARLKNAPDEIAGLEARQGELKTRQTNLVKHIAKFGDASEAINAELMDIERDLNGVTTRLNELRVAKVDKLLVTPFALKARYEKLAESFDKDPVKANAALRVLLRDGLKCTPIPRTKGRKCNPNENLWKIEGTVLVGGQGRFSNLLYGGPERVRTSDLRIRSATL